MTLPEATTPLSLALTSAAGLAAFLTLLGKYIQWVIRRKDDSFEKVRADADAVEVKRVALRAQDDQEMRARAKQIFDERGKQVADLNIAQDRMRANFDAEIANLKCAIKQEGEERQMVKLSADAAHLRADEAVTDLAAAKRDRDEIERRLVEATGRMAAVEARANRAEEFTSQIERDKNIEIDILSRQLAESNRKIETLEKYIREHKMQVTLQHGEEIITASMEPLDEPPTKDTDFSL